MFAYLLLERLRTQGLSGTELERATAGSLRLKLLKIAAQVRVSVRRVYVQMSSAFPLQELFAALPSAADAAGSPDGLSCNAKSLALGINSGKQCAQRWSFWLTYPAFALGSAAGRQKDLSLPKLCSPIPRRALKLEAV